MKEIIATEEPYEQKWIYAGNETVYICISRGGNVYPGTGTKIIEAGLGSGQFTYYQCQCCYDKKEPFHRIFR